MIEIWKNIEWYNWQYKISNLWRVKRLEIKIIHLCWLKTLKEKILKQQNNWYIIISQLWYLHRLVAKAFIPNSNNYTVVRHLNDIKTDNRIENLARWTYWDNWKDAYKNWKIPYMLWKKWILCPNSKILWKNNKHSKKIWQYTKDLEFIKEWYWSWEIQRKLWYFASSITRCCLNWKRTAYWFMWKYID